MRHRFAAILAALVLVITGLAASPAVAGAPPIVPVGPHQQFAGLVNGVSTNATITVICVGPLATGHPAQGQTVGVALVTGPVIGPISSFGYTGDKANSIAAGQPDTSATASPIAVFTGYEKQPLSTKLTLPCGGTGTIMFMPSPNAGGRAATVTVRFTSIGY